MGQQVSHFEFMGFVSSLAFYSSPFRTSAQMLEAARSSRHGCKLGGGVWLWNERIKWRDGGAGAPQSRHFIRNGPTKHGIYKQGLLLFNAPTYRLFRSVNSLGQRARLLLLTFFLLICVRWSLSFSLFFPLHGALTDIVCLCSIDNPKCKHRSV